VAGCLDHARVELIDVPHLSPYKEVKSFGGEHSARASVTRLKGKSKVHGEGTRTTN